MSSKAKIIISNILLIFGFLSVVAGFNMILLYRDIIVGIVSTLVLSIISIIAGVVMWKVSGHPVVESSVKSNAVKQPIPKKHKCKRRKETFLTDEDWKELGEEEEEDDENQFIDDKDEY